LDRIRRFRFQFRSRRRRLGLCVVVALCIAPGSAWADDLICLILPQRAITLSAAIEGVVEEVLVERGDLVKRDQILARLESGVEEASVELAKARAEAEGAVLSGEARLELAENTYVRQRMLEDQSIVSSQEVEEALAARQVATAELLVARDEKKMSALELVRARAALERRQIRSPFDGVVVERILSEGEYADPPEILKLAQVDPLRVEVYVPLERIGRIKVGMVAEVRPEEPVGGVHNATVTVVDSVVDAASATFGVRLELPNSDHAIAAGLNCRVRFPVE
jgi:RND family efflux transporter MFP subunit